MTRPCHPEIFSLHLEPAAPLADEDPTHIGTHEIRSCLITTSLAHAHWGRYKAQEALFVKYCFHFVASHGIRFKAAEVRVKFGTPRREPRVRTQPTGADTRKGPSIIAYEPKRWTGKSALRTVEKKVEASLGGYQDIVPRVSMGRDTSEEGEFQARLDSTTAAAATIVWKLEENQVTQGGIPNPLEAAMIIATGGEELAVDLRFEVHLTKSFNPLSWVPAYVRKNEGLTLEKAREVGESIAGILEMEKDSFQLAPFVRSVWEL